MDEKADLPNFDNLSVVKNLMNEDTFDQDVIFLRGTILTGTITIERKMDEFLSSYFCANKKKKNELCELLFFTERISFDIKRQILQVILSSHYGDFLKKYPDFFSRLESIVPHRNIFAHLEADKINSITTGEEEKQTVVFKRYKSGKNKPQTYTMKEIGELSASLVAMDFYFEFLLTAMPPLV